MEYFLSLKSELLLFISKQQGELISIESNDSMKFFQSYQDLMDILHKINDKDYNIFKFIYHYRNIIHSILYDSDETININNFKLKFDFVELFYLDLLITENEVILNYEYSFDTLNSYLIKIKSFKGINYNFYKIVGNKILLDLIKNFCESDNYEKEINGQQIDKIKKEAEEEINNNIDKIKELFNINEDDIENLKLDELYCKILISLIKSNKFNDYNYLYNFLQAIEIEKISIGNAISTPLKELIKNNNDYMEQFIIKTEEDLYDEKIINFYYILLYFILKNDIFIYQLQFLLETKKTIIKLIKSNKIKNDKINNLSEEIIERYQYVLKTFAGSEYYFEPNQINKLHTILKYFKLFYFKSKVNDIEKIEQDIKNKNFDSEFLTYYQEAVKDINFYPIIERLFYTPINKEINSEKSLTKNMKKFKIVYKLIKDRKFSKMRNKKDYFNFFNDKDNHELLLKVFTQEDIDSFINDFEKPKKNLLINYEFIYVSILTELQYDYSLNILLQLYEEIDAEQENEKKAKKK